MRHAHLGIATGATGVAQGGQVVALDRHCLEVAPCTPRHNVFERQHGASQGGDCCLAGLAPQDDSCLQGLLLRSVQDESLVVSKLTKQ